MGATGPALSIWSGGQLRTEAFPTGAKPSSCLWSPDGKTLLCGYGGQENSRQWLLASASGGAMTVAAGTGFPVAWLP